VQFFSDWLPSRFASFLTPVRRWSMARVVLQTASIQARKSSRRTRLPFRSSTILYTSPFNAPLPVLTADARSQEQFSLQQFSSAMLGWQIR
jgi:hypothetical protein